MHRRKASLCGDHKPPRLKQLHVAEVSIVSHLLNQYWLALAAPASRMLEHFSKRGAQVAKADTGAESTRAERLEHIAICARAGYFNLGYTVDAFHAPVETPSH
jgi:sugar phosphate isomerase/epimerase